MPRLYENHTLSTRERQVIDLAGRGLTDLQIAHELGISESTVTTYWDRIRLKYGAHHRTELVLRVNQEDNKAILDRMRQQNEQLAARLRESSGPLLREILDDLEEPIIVVDDTDTIKLANAEAARLFGYELHQMDGQSHTMLVPDEFRDVHSRRVRAYHLQPVAERMDAHVEVWARHGTGQVFRLHAFLTPLHTAEGTLVMCRMHTNETPPAMYPSPEKAA